MSKRPFGVLLSLVLTGVVVAGSAAPAEATTYDALIVSDTPDLYWRLGEGAGPVANDASGNNETGTFSGAPSFGAGGLSGTSGNAVTFGATTGVESSVTFPPSHTFTIEAWFQTTSTAGGRIVGFSSGGQPHDRDVWMTNGGNIRFGVYNTAMHYVTSPDAYNDGGWHHVVATLSGAGERLYVDGLLVASDSTVTTAQLYTGRWGAGYEANFILTEWLGSTNRGLVGTIDEVAVWNTTAISAAQVAAHFENPGFSIGALPAQTFHELIVSQSPSVYWRLSESSGTVAVNSSGHAVNGTYAGSPTFGTPGLLGVDGDAVTFSSTTALESNELFDAKDQFTVEAWIKTTSISGGRIIGMAGGSDHDHHIWMKDDGTVSFGVFDGATRIITSPGAVNDGNWHQVAATLSGAGQRLYVDGVLAASDGAVTGALGYTGSWGLGYLNIWDSVGWPGATNKGFTGAIDEAAAWNNIILSDAQIAAHYAYVMDLSSIKTAVVSGIVDPALTFTVAGRATTCNGQSSAGFQSGSSASSVSLGHLSPLVIGGGAQNLTVATNAGGGFAVYIRTSATTPNSFRTTGGDTVADVAGTHAAPSASLSAGTAGFGYTTADASIAFGANNWAKLTAVDDTVLVGGAGVMSKTSCTGFQASVASTTAAGSYAVPILYTAVPSF